MLAILWYTFATLSIPVSFLGCVCFYWLTLRFVFLLVVVTEFSDNIVYVCLAHNFYFIAMSYLTLKLPLYWCDTSSVGRALFKTEVISSNLMCRSPMNRLMQNSEWIISLLLFIGLYILFLCEISKFLSQTMSSNREEGRCFVGVIFHSLREIEVAYY